MTMCLHCLPACDACPVQQFWQTAKARRVGLDTVTANIPSEFAVKDMELTSFKTLIAATPADEVNATAAREFSKVLGDRPTSSRSRSVRSLQAPREDTRTRPITSRCRPASARRKRTRS